MNAIIKRVQQDGKQQSLPIKEDNRYVCRECGEQLSEFLVREAGGTATCLFCGSEKSVVKVGDFEAWTGPRKPA